MSRIHNKPVTPHTGSTVRETSWHGLPAVELTSEALTALVVPEIGCNLVSLRTAHHAELLFSPPDASALRQGPFRFGVPVLFPPGRVAGGAFHAKGRVYQWPLNDGGRHHLHGFVYDQTWTITNKTAVPGHGAELSTRYAAPPGSPVAQTFGHPFEIQLSYRLSGAELTCCCTIHNLDIEPMPVAIGFHPYFAAHSDLQVRIPVEAEWVLADLIPTGQRQDTALCELLRTGSFAQELALDHVFSAQPAPGGTVFCDLIDAARRLRLTLRWQASDFPYLVLFTGSRGAPFFSIEPYSWVPNAPNLPLPGDETGLTWLQPKEARTWTWQLEVQRLR